MQLRLREVGEPASNTVQSRTTAYHWLILFCVCLLACFGGYKVMARMTSGGARDRPGKPQSLSPLIYDSDSQGLRENPIFSKLLCGLQQDRAPERNGRSRIETDGSLKLRRRNQ
jgi:hypothetical protein